LWVKLKQLYNRLQIIKKMKIATVLQAAATLVGAFSDLDLERNSIEVPRIGQDVNVTCGGKEIRIEVSPHYIQRNSAWLGDGSFLRILLTTHTIVNSIFGT